MSDIKETWWDNFLSKHDKFFHFLMKYWYGPKRKLKWYLNVPAVIQDYRWRRQFKPGSFYLDHGHHPMQLIELDDYDNLRGISLVDGREINSDLYHCGPVPCTAEFALTQVPVYLADQERTNAGTEATD